MYPQICQTSLVKLYLSLNKIQHVDQYDFQNLTELQVLDLSGKCPRCTNAPFPCEGAVLTHKIFFSLILCWFASNPLALSWVSRTLPCDVTVTNNNTLIHFDCSARRLREVPKDITWNATSLQLSQNEILLSNLSFHNLRNLINISLNWSLQQKGKHISKGTFSSLTKLQVLFLDGNFLDQMPDGLPPGLRMLSLNSNSLLSVSKKNFSGVPNLTEISINKNCYYWNPCNGSLYIENGSFSHLINLNVLSLSYNSLSQVPGNLPSSLVKLYLSSNKLQFIRENDFLGLSELQVLDLSGNCPRCENAPFPCEPCPNKAPINIHAYAFQSLRKLQTLHLSGNSLQHLQSTWFKNCPNLKHLFLSFNYLMSEIAQGDFLNSLPRVEMLDLSFNYKIKGYPQKINLSSNFKKLESLRVLHIEGYVFREIDQGDLGSLYNLTNLTVLNLGTNFVKRTNLKEFQNFFNLKLIYLSENRLSPDSRGNGLFYGTANEGNQVFSSPSVKDHGSYINKDDTGNNYHLSHLLVKHECFVYGQVLDLSLNNIFFIAPEQFEGFENISCLNLSSNGFSNALNGTEFIFLPKLKYLDLTYNKIDLAYDYAFAELQQLEVLDLSYNLHYFVVAGVTHNLGFLKNLQFLKVLNLSWNEIYTLTNRELTSKSLKELKFKGNRLDILWKGDDNRYITLFKNLSNLTHLDISNNRLKRIPSNVYCSLPSNLTELYLSGNGLQLFDWEKLAYFNQLEVLALGDNSLTYVTEKLSIYTNTLRILDLSHNKITQLSDGFLQQARSLQYLYLSHNYLKLINQSTFPSGPNNYLKTLHLEGNPFQCTCDILDFILWIKSNDVAIPRLATDVNCAMPEDRRGKGIITFDLYECENNITSAILCLFSFFAITFTMAVAVIKHLFYWDAWYFYHYFKAKVKGYRTLESTDNVYDAFITYDTKDPVVSDWVLNNLRVNLEDQRDRALLICLEERDWQPGVPVIDNLSQSIRQSRKTVFVLTDRYVKSGNFRIAFYMAHQRLMDENVDVIVLVLLEPVLQHSQFLRLRKRLCRSSILEWPTNPHAEVWFWQCLRNVIKVDNRVLYNNLYSGYFTAQ
ncbi:toll-like receptor 8 [Acipenser oxyrinchus oxyrinchus]|uniref:Toll-like receptor 8 n=1 Tax=Acipenser oxyrinchus oxyrinchus TaxID=40147 RepID=A0AAD8G3W8_ACIOX|nr:toll-like receptor 8 [Acipenser oxyrinchus oxyrinchus]